MKQIGNNYALETVFVLTAPMGRLLRFPAVFGRLHIEQISVKQRVEKIFNMRSLDALKTADEVSNVLPPHLHGKYCALFNNTVRKEQWVEIYVQLQGRQ